MLPIMMEKLIAILAIVNIGDLKELDLEEVEEPSYIQASSMKKKFHFLSYVI
jgi:hypothetical protein